jgi:hypothetical protein
MTKTRNRHDALSGTGKHKVKTNAHKAGHLKIDHHKKSTSKRRASKKTIL